MIKDLIANTAILVAFLFLAGDIIKYKIVENGILKLKTSIGGFISGFLGIILMIYSVSLPFNVIIDLRQLAIIVIAILGGALPALIAGVIMSLFRILYFGINQTSISAAILILLVSIMCSIITKLKLSQNKKWFLMNACSIIAFSIFIIITLKKSHIVLITLIYYCVISAFAGCLVSYITKHIVLSASLYNKYKTESTKDFLTGLSNVRNFDLQFNHFIDNSKNSGDRLSVLMIDIDFFKKVNDTYGHAIGDDVLKELASVISKNTEYVSRIGGEEFCVLLPKNTTTAAWEIAESIRKAVEEHIFTSNRLKITVSIGVATFPDTVTNVEHILKEADKALYLSKQTGRNKVSINN